VSVFHLDASEEFPVALIAGASQVFEPSVALEFMEGYFWLLLLGRLFDHFFLGLLLRSHFCNLSTNYIESIGLFKDYRFWEE
jgi:hypothetical protein